MTDVATIVTATKRTRKLKTPKVIDPEAVRISLLAIETQLTDTFVQREEAARVILLGVLSQQNYLLVGPPGTAKTSVIDCFTRHVITDRRFKILMGRFTQPEHVFGPLDIEAFKRGEYRTVTDNMMTDAVLPILDEALKASDGCMNSLLGVLGPEREFQQLRTGIICTGAATNWPEVDALSKNVEALYDRFLLRCSVEAVDRNDKVMRRKLFRAAAEMEGGYKPGVQVTVDDLRAAAADVTQIEISDPVIDLLDGLVGRLMAPKTSGGGQMVPSGIEVSDRRVTQLQRVLQANAWLEGRNEVTIEDFDVLRHGLWSKRLELEAIDSTLDTIDSQAVQEIVKLATTGREAYRKVKSAGFGAAQIMTVDRQIKEIAFEVKARLQQPIFTKKGRGQVKNSMKGLQADYEALRTVAKKKAGVE